MTIFDKKEPYFRQIFFRKNAKDCQFAHGQHNFNATNVNIILILIIKMTNMIIEIIRMIKMMIEIIR